MLEQKGWTVTAYRMFRSREKVDDLGVFDTWIACRDAVDAYEKKHRSTFVRAVWERNYVEMDDDVPALLNDLINGPLGGQR